MLSAGSAANDALDGSLGQSLNAPPHASPLVADFTFEDARPVNPTMGAGAELAPILDQRRRYSEGEDDLAGVPDLSQEGQFAASDRVATAAGAELAVLLQQRRQWEEAASGKGA